MDRWRPTLLIDEFDSFGGVKEDLRGVLNSGHKKSHAFITRSVGHRHEPKLFSTWCPKSLALIDGKIETAGLASTLRDRSIIIHMRRKTKAEHVDRFREQDVVSEFAEVRSQLVRWSQDHLTEIDAAYRAKINTPSGLNDRQINNWEPLLALAAVVAGEWPKLAYEAAQILSSDMDDDDEAQASGVELLHDVRTIFNRAPQHHAIYTRHGSVVSIVTAGRPSLGPISKRETAYRSSTRKDVAEIPNPVAANVGVRWRHWAEPQGLYRASFQRRGPLPPR